MSCIPGPKVNISWQRVTRSADGIGGFTESWTTQETFKTTIGQMNAYEALRYDKDTVTNMYTMFADYRKANGGTRDFREQDRIIYGSQTFEIVGIENLMLQGRVYKIALREVK